MKSRNALFVMFSAVLLVACVDPSPVPDEQSLLTKTSKDFEIEFVVQGGGGPNPSLKVVTPNQGCALATDGCMRVKKSNKAEITFKFQNVQQRPCSAHPNSWVISKIEMADFAKTFGGSVSPWIVSDFGADSATGMVWQMSDGDEVSSVKIDDANDNVGVAYYQITVQTCNAAKDAITDPRVENEGIG